MSSRIGGWRCWRAVLCSGLGCVAEAQLAPGSAVDDGDVMDDVLEGDGAPVQACVVVEEVLDRGAFEEQAPGLSLDDEVEAQLRGASSSQVALGAVTLEV